MLCSVDLSVKGFNFCKVSKAIMVEVFLSVGDVVHGINAITVPGFEWDIFAPDLSKAVDMLYDMGYILADRHLYDDGIIHIKFMMGSNYAGVLPVRTKLHTADMTSVPSSFLETPLGVKLQGSVGRIWRDSGILKQYTQDGDSI